MISRSKVIADKGNMVNANLVNETPTLRRSMLIGVGGFLASIAGHHVAAASPPPSSDVGSAALMKGELGIRDKAEDPRITRARLSGPKSVTKDATVAELGPDGSLAVLVQGTNEWICVPGDENRIGSPSMCMNPLGLRWMMDAMQGKPKPTNEAPGMIYMLCGATQRSNIDPSDKTGAAIPIGPHWMVTWPFDAAQNGLPTTARDKGAWIMFAGTPYAYLHVCGDPWDGTEYHENEKAIWTMSYGHHE